MAEKVDFKYNDGSKVFMISDTHFHHEMIMKFCNRPFSSVEEMNAVMIEKWNNKVPKDGLVFHLGDFAWGGYPKWKEIRDQLNGKIILIKGNHDRKNLTKTGESLFEFVTPQMKIEVEGQQMYLNHYPLLCYSGTYRDRENLVWALNGHTHIGPNSKSGLDFDRMRMALPTQYDVGVDMNNFEPISFQEVSDKINYQIDHETNMMHWI